jgi:trehalose 6-phosphate phosphatase
VRDGLAEFATAHPGLLLEDKGASMAMHYRLAPHCEPVVRRAMEYARVAVGSGYALQPGKLVLELKPRDAHKGLAIRAFLDEAPFRGRRPVFVADDATDEDGFAVVNALHGVTIKVGTGPSAARFGLADPRAVTRWLARGGRARRRAQAPRVRAVGAHRGGDDA